MTMNIPFPKTPACILLVLFLFPASAFAELRPLLPEKSLWSVVHDPPAVGKKWTTMYPLPKDKKVRGELNTEDGTWPSNKKSVFMTTELELPEDYQPGNLYAQYQHDDGIQIAVNGTMVIQRRGAGISGGKVVLYRKRVPNLLKPGKNIIAVFCNNIEKTRGLVNFALYTDDEPLAQDAMLFTPDQKWSVTFNDPGANWTAVCPLPGGSVNFAPFCTSGGGWDKKHLNIWLTCIVTLPKDYKPELLHAEVMCDNDMWLYINGEEVLTRGLTTNWAFVKNLKNPLQPGKNIIAVRCYNRPNPKNKKNQINDALIALDLYVEAMKTDEESGFSMPTRPPRDEEDEEEPEPEDDLTDAEKLIVKGLNLLKEGKEKPAVEALQEAAKADAEDFHANYVLAMLSLTKIYEPASALKCMQACVKIDAQNPCVLNNYGVAAVENKKYAVAIESWRRLAKNYPTLAELQQNVGFLTELADNKLVKLTDEEQRKLETLYREICGSHDVKIDKTAGFLLMPLSDGVGADPKYAELFVQEYKRGKEKVTGNPYEVKRAYFQKN